ncbi:sugar phosphate isomerase/epimerase family protein [Thiohalophilus sp.]|uniref:sugar phosphate isomerase/epimerase family protein n=1 Tax=Thiohalophilus sp. TaxID=3028392 RepID=UPI0039770B1D
MQLKLFKTLWGFDGNYTSSLEQALSDGFDGIEGPAPGAQRTADRFQQQLAEHQLDYIAEITTAGSYVPDRHATLEQHLDSLIHKLSLSRPLDPLFVTCLGGCDAWPESLNIEFFGRAMEIAKQFEVTISFETHRGRALFNPWLTHSIVQQLPDMLLTCDFSHWCVVCERLVDTEFDIIRELAPHAHHIHARVGYDQGPQVPHPAAPEYAEALVSHQAWWELIWKNQKDRRYALSTMTPEFGPDGYLHEAPFTREPVAELRDLNNWMASTEREHFETFSSCQ